MIRVVETSICAVAVSGNQFLGYILRSSEGYEIYLGANKVYPNKIYALRLDEYKINPEAISGLVKHFLRIIPFTVIMEADVSLSGHKFNVYIEKYGKEGNPIDIYYLNSETGEEYSILFPQNNKCFIEKGDVYTYD